MIERSAGYHEVYVYTMGRPGFILQHVVDAWIVQSANEATKPIAVFFGLAGLHLRVEKRCSGTDVQRIHQRLAQQRKDWPALTLPADRGPWTVNDVLAAPPGEARDEAIDAWCRSVWQAMSPLRPRVIALLAECDIR